MKVLLNSFHLNGYTLGFIHRLKSQNHLVQHNKQYHMNVLLKSFHLNAYIVRFVFKSGSLLLFCLNNIGWGHLN